MAYLGGWLVCSALACAAAFRSADRSIGTARIVTLSVLAGMVWPLLLLGALQVGSVATWTAIRAWRRTESIPELWITRTPERVYSLS